MKIILPKNLIHDGNYHEEDAIQAVVNYVNYLIDNFYKFDEIPELCKEIYYVDYYICETENGGLAQFVWNSKWGKAERDYIRKGLKTIQALEHLQFFEKFESEIEALKEELSEFLETDFWEAAVVKAKINQRTEEFYNLEESIRNKSYNFIKSYPDFVLLEGDELQAEADKLKEANPHYAERKAAKEKRIKEAAKANPLIELGSLMASEANLDFDEDNPYSLRPFSHDSITKGVHMMLYVLKSEDRNYDVYVYEKDATLFYKEDGIVHFVTEVQIPIELRKKLFKDYEEKEQELNPIDFFAAAHSGNKEKMKRLIDQGFDINTVLGDWEETALYVAARAGQLDSIKFLTENNADYSLTNYSGMSVLLKAAEEKQFIIVNYLIDIGQDIKQLDSRGSGIIHYLADDKKSENFIPEIEELIGKGAPLVPNNSGETPLYKALYNGCYKLAEKLLELGVDAGAGNHTSRNVLRCLNAKKTSEEKYNMAKLLIKHGARPVPGELDPIISCDVKCVQLFLENGSDINSCNSSGYSALHCSAGSFELDKVKLLIELGADHTAIMDWGKDEKRTCLDTVERTMEDKIGARFRNNEDGIKVRDYLLSVGVKRASEL